MDHPPSFDTMHCGVSIAKSPQPKNSRSPRLLVERSLLSSGPFISKIMRLPNSMKELSTTLRLTDKHFHSFVENFQGYSDGTPVKLCNRLVAQLLELTNTSHTVLAAEGARDFLSPLVTQMQEVGSAILNLEGAWGPYETTRTLEKQISQLRDCIEQILFYHEQGVLAEENRNLQLMHQQIYGSL